MGYIKELTLRGTKGFDRFMRDRLHWRLSTRSLVFYYLGQFQEQVLAVVPVTLCLVITLAIYFGRTVENPGKLTGGLLSAMFGLVLFVDGLRVAIMPMCWNPFCFQRPDNPTCIKGIGVVGLANSTKGRDTK